MKKTTAGFAFVLLALLGVLGFVSCEKKVAAPPAGPVTVIYYTWDDTSIKPIIDAFNASQSEIFVDAQYLPSPDYETKITTLLTGRTEMDAYMQKRQVDMFPQYDNGFIEPLDDLLAKTGVNRVAVDAYKNSLSVDGKIIAFPWRGAAYYTFFNKKLFADKGVSTPDTYVKEGTWTWDKFAEVAKQVSSGDGKIYGASVYHWGSSQLIMESQRQKSIISADGRLDYDDGIRRWLSIRKAMEEEKSMWPLVDMKVTATHYSKQFYDGQTAMLIIGEWFPGQILAGRDQGVLKGWGWNDWGLTRIPSDSDPYVTMGAPTFSHVTSYAKNKEAALRFIAWMGGPEGAKIAAKAGVLPGMVDEEVKEVLRESIPDQDSLEYFVEDKISFPMGYNKYGSRIENLINTLQEEYLLGKIPDSQFDERLNAELREIINTTN
ncbi:MAG: extracellular solute-binding protein [Treponema sp.]|jgi:multiple sugar transport system substrate-binding protein|nr:extracellular solute-binding protein [Treponema sp.]